MGNEKEMLRTYLEERAIGRDRRQVRIGMVGYKFMGKAHSHAYRDLPFYFDLPVVPVRQALAGRDEAGVRDAAERWGWASYETDWRRLVERDDIDAIDIGTPNNTHYEIAIAAVRAGKHVVCEKPLALTVEQARHMCVEAEKAGVVHMICHNYRFAPAVQFAKKLIADGKLGTIHHMRAVYLQDWMADPQVPINWKSRKEISGSGALGDIGAHIVDLARFLVGELTEVTGMMETFVKRRPLAEGNRGTTELMNAVRLNGDAAGGGNGAEGGGTVGNNGGRAGSGSGGVLDGTPGAGGAGVLMGDVDVDDAAAFLARFANGALGTFEATRFAKGNRNGNRFEINGSRGSIRWDLENMNNLQLYLESDGEEPGIQGFRTINCMEAVHPYASQYWPAGHIIGYEHTFINLLSQFMRGIAGECRPLPDFRDGLHNQLVLDAVERSSLERRWVTVEL